MAIPREYEQYEPVVSVACVNFQPAWGNKEANLTRIKALVTEAASQGNNIIAFPELALSGYECDERGAKTRQPCAMHEAAAETVPGPSTEAVAKLAKKLGVYVLLGMPEQDREDPRVRYISAAIIAPEGIIGTYRKLHLARPPAGTETSCFQPGNSLPLFETRYGPIGVLICYDFYMFPELARLLALKGARLIFNLTASSSGPGKRQLVVQQTAVRAAENFVYTASANLVGKEVTKSYYGHSCIAAPLAVRPGFMLAVGEETEEIVSATLSFERLHSLADRLPWKRQRQARLIADEFARFAALPPDGTGKQG